MRSLYIFEGQAWPRISKSLGTSSIPGLEDRTPEIKRGYRRTKAFNGSPSPVAPDSAVPRCSKVPEPLFWPKIFGWCGGDCHNSCSWAMWCLHRKGSISSYHPKSVPFRLHSRWCVCIVFRIRGSVRGSVRASSLLSRSVWEGDCTKCIPNVFPMSSQCIPHLKCLKVHLNWKYFKSCSSDLKHAPKVLGPSSQGLCTFAVWQIVFGVYLQPETSCAQRSTGQTGETGAWAKCHKRCSFQ